MGMGVYRGKGKVIKKPQKQVNYEAASYFEKQQTDNQQLNTQEIYDSRTYQLIVSGGSNEINISAGGAVSSAAGTTGIGKNFVATFFRGFAGWREGSGIGIFAAGIRITRGGVTILAMSAQICGLSSANSNMIVVTPNIKIKSDDVVEAFYSGSETGGVNGITAVYSVALYGVSLD